MADNASIARPYAKAVFDLAQEANAFDAWAGALQHLSLVAQDDGFSGLLNDPKVGRNRLAELLIDLAKDSLPKDGGANLVNLLVQNDRLDLLPEIEQQYKQLVLKAQQSVDAQVLTAIALTDAQKKTLTSALETKLGLKVTLSEVVDNSLIGGAIVKAGDLVIDGSAKGRIEKLATTLAR